MIFVSILLGIIFGFLFMNQVGSMVVADGITFSFTLLILFIVFCLLNIVLSIFNKNSKQIRFVCDELDYYFGNELEIQGIIKSGKKKKLLSSVINGFIIPLFVLGISFVISNFLNNISIYLSIGFICFGVAFVLLSLYYFNNYNSFAVSVREYILFNVNYYNFIMGSDSYWLKALISVNNQPIQTNVQTSQEVQHNTTVNRNNKSCQQDTQSVTLSEDLESDLLDGLFGDDFDEPNNSNNSEIDDIFK